MFEKNVLANIRYLLLISVRVWRRLDYEYILFFRSRQDDGLWMQLSSHKLYYCCSFLLMLYRVRHLLLSAIQPQQWQRQPIMFLKSLIAKELCLVIFHCNRRILDFKRFPVIISANRIILSNSTKDLLVKVYDKYIFCTKISDNCIHRGIICECLINIDRCIDCLGRQYLQILFLEKTAFMLQLSSFNCNVCYESKMPDSS